MINFGERMLLYSQFLNAQGHKKSLQHTLFVTNWLHEVYSPDCLQLFGMNEIYQRLWDGFQRSITDFCRQDWVMNLYNDPQQESVFLDAIDSQTLFFIQTVSSMIELKTRKSPIEFIPFDFPKKQGGVSIQAYLYYEFERHPFHAPIHGALGQPKKELCITADIINNSMFFCQDAEHQKLVTLRFKQNKFHGEESWMGQYGKSLISELQNHLYQIQNIDITQTKAFDQFWIMNYTHPSRLEFVLNTAPCSDCRALFKSFREKLNNMCIYIPILIHALYPCHSGEESEISPIQILNFQGELILTKIFTNTSYNQMERAGQSLFVHANLDNTEMFFIKSYPLLSACQKHLMDGKNLDFIFTPLVDFIKTKKLNKADIGTIYGCLKGFPDLIKNKNYYDCLNLLKNKSPSNTLSALNAHQIEELLDQMKNMLNEHSMEDLKIFQKTCSRTFRKI